MLKTKSRSFGKIFIIFCLLAIMAVGLSLPLSAQSLNQGYSSDEPLQQGMLVKEKANDRSKVEPVKQSDAGYIKGVVVGRNDSAVVIASEDQNVFVANSGMHDVLVSDEGGAIKKGDYLSISSIAGIAMKTDNNQTIVIGRAAGDFTGKGDSIGSTTRESDKKNINLGRISVDISIAANPTRKQATRDTVPKIFKDISSSVAGKPVTNGRIWLASIVFLASSIITGIMFYSGARSSLLALGRNPLSKTSILKGLVQIVVLGIIVFICGLFGVYLLLKL